MLIETEGLMTPKAFSEYYGLLTRKKAYSPKWVFGALSKAREAGTENQLPFTIHEIGGVTFFKLKTETEEKKPRRKK